MTDSKLVVIPASDWLRLRNLYRQNWPANLLGFYTVDTFLRWQEQETEIKHLIIYSLDGDWETDGTYVCIVSTDVCSDGILCLSFVCLYAQIHVHSTDISCSPIHWTRLWFVSNACYICWIGHAAIKSARCWTAFGRLCKPSLILINTVSNSIAEHFCIIFHRSWQLHSTQRTHI